MIDITDDVTDILLQRPAKKSIRTTGRIPDMRMLFNLVDA